MSLRRFRDISNQNFGVLGDSKNNNLVRYNAPIERYTLESEDNILASAQVLDGDLPDDFVTTIENQMDAANLDFSGLDGGSF